jgi:glycosyltransferase involved in cell wall biosynthesis
VIIPSKDRPSTLARVVPSYLAQPEVAELVIVDDGSTPDAGAAIDRLVDTDPRIRLVRHAVNRGVPAAKNSGIDAARCPLVLFGEDDLELTPGYVATLVAHRQERGADVISGRNVWRFEDESAEEALARAPDPVATAVDRRRIAVDQTAQLMTDTEELLVAATMLAPLGLFRALRFDERYKANGWREETDFQLRVVASGARLVSCPHAVSYNYLLAGDRGGVHATTGIIRTFWMIRNNALFLSANKDIIAREFDLGNRYLYWLRFLSGAMWDQAILPGAVWAVRSIRRAIRGPS